MGKGKAAKSGTGPSAEFTQRMMERLLERALTGGDSMASVTLEAKDLPNCCGECRYFYGNPGRSISRCHRHPPVVPESLYNSKLDAFQDFEFLRPPVLPEDVACGDGERR